MTEVVLVDKNDKVLGTMEKMEAHRKAILHRAISVFIINSKGEWLLQQRAAHKYHSAGLWTNSTCTHPEPGESYQKAANRRLMEEIGLEADLQPLFSFIYKEKLDNELTEHELDHVFIGFSDELPVLNPDEVMDYQYIRFEDLDFDVAVHPEKYTVWFKKIYQCVHESALVKLDEA